MGKKLKKIVPFMMIGIMTFLGVMAGFILYNVKHIESLSFNTPVLDRKNILMVETNADGYGSKIEIAMIDPKTNMINIVSIPNTINVDISSSTQTLKSAMAIGKISVVEEKLNTFLPIPIHYYAVFEDGENQEIIDKIKYLNYDDKINALGTIKNIILSIDTNLSSFETDEYVTILSKIDFSLTQRKTLPISNKAIDKYDLDDINKFFNDILDK